MASPLNEAQATADAAAASAQQTADQIQQPQVPPGQVLPYGKKTSVWPWIVAGLLGLGAAYVVYRVAKKR